MPMSGCRLRRPLVVMSLLFSIALLSTTSVRADQSGSDEEQKKKEEERLKKLDSGPATIDVSKYPAEQQGIYKVFAKKCSSCHSLARAINSDYAVLPAEWERYIKRMMFKPNSGISSDEGKALFRFLVYDSSARKPEAVKKRLEGLKPEEQTAAVEKVKSVNPAFAAP